MQHLLLDLMVDGPSSFAGLFGGLCDRHNYLATGAAIDTTLDALTEMVDLGWVRLRRMTEAGRFEGATPDEVLTARSRYREWLPSATRDERAVDEIGLWYEITECGRDEWARWSKDAEGTRTRWAVDDDNLSRVITVHAASLSDAEDAFSTWVAQHPGMKLLYGTKDVSSLDEFRLRSGVVISDGVTVRCGYSCG